MSFQPAFAKHLSLFLCTKYLCRKKIVLLSVAAVMISSALLIVVASLFSGFIRTIEATVTDHSADIVITAPSAIKIPNYDKLIEAIESDVRVESATAVLSGYGGLLYLDKGDVRAVKIMGLQMPKHAEVMPFGEFLVVQNDLATLPVFGGEGDKPGAFVGIGCLAVPDETTDEYDVEKLKAEYIGKTVGVTTVRGGGQRPIFIKFTVTDFVFSGFHIADSDTIYVPIEALNSKLFPGNKSNVADTIQIKVAAGVSPDSQVEKVQQAWQKFATEGLGWSGYAVGAVRVETSYNRWARLISEYRKQMNMLIMIFSIVSGGVVLLISCVFYLIVMTKKKDIAVVKSCGLGASAVASLFVCFGLLIGCVGSSLGVGLGYIVIRNINAIERMISVSLGLKLWKSSTYMFSRIPSQMDWGWAGIIFMVAVVAAGIGALVPAILAACVRPVKILRYE